MSNDQIINVLTIVLGIMISILVVLCLVFIVLKFKSNKLKNKKLENKTTVKAQSTSSQNYSKQSIFKFMEFDKISDNMIVQREGKRFLMVIECQGINYDLMSGLEKNSVEQGFLQFLNTLRYPIQIYVQTRTVNLGKSINTYKERVEDISRQYVNKQMEYNQKVRSGHYSDRELDKERFELTRQRNLYEYGIDIVNNTERMSLNRNILSKCYYVIIPYYPEESSNTNFDKEEISNIAFSELYTKAQSIISSLSVCGIKSKVLDSNEIAELLYIAYNRDESEIFDLQKALNAGYEDLYTTAPDVFEKRMKELDIKIQKEGIRKANEVVLNVIEENEKQRQAKVKEEELEDLIDEFAKILIGDNKRTIGQDIANDAIQKINEDKEFRNETKEKGGMNDEQKVKKTTRRRTKSAV